MSRFNIFKGYGNVRFSAYWVTKRDTPGRPAFRAVFMNKRGRCFRVSSNEWDHDRKYDTDSRYRPYRYLQGRVGSLTMVATQKRAGLGLIPMLRERKARGL